jgi:cell division protein FtsZ
VGNTIEEFASPEATVVVGTVIDPELTDELRVTVVATGLGRAEAPKVTVAPTKVVDNTRTADGGLNYAVLDKPTVMRANAAAASRPAGNAARALETRERDMEYLDIPAFLRRQVD